MSDDIIKYLDDATLMKIANGAKPPIQEMCWKRSDSMKVPIFMWLEKYDILPGQVPVKGTTLYTHFVAWADASKMDFIASGHLFARTLNQKFAFKKFQNRTKMFFLNKVPE